MLKVTIAAILCLFLSAQASAKEEAKEYRKGTLMAVNYHKLPNGSSYFGTEVGDGVVISGTPRMMRAYAITVGLDDLAYLLEYEAKYAWSKKPILTVGDPIEVRLDKKGEKMFLLLSNGKELKTRVIQKTRLPPPGTPIDEDLF